MKQTLSPAVPYQKKDLWISQFAHDVTLGLSQHPKSVPSRYFYDKEGDKIFQQIMNMPEYYITSCEHDIFMQQGKKMCQVFHEPGETFNLIEFGAGDGYKTKVLLKKLLEDEADFTYNPVDISKNILEELNTNLKNELPGMKVRPLNMEYFSALSKLSELNTRRNVVLFLGANIGNFSREAAGNFLSRISWYCKPGDLLLLGADLKKDPQIISLAYNDPHGITAAFNLNLLQRMNRELGADFDTNSFVHHTFYEPQSGEVLSYLVSLRRQTVRFAHINMEVSFEAFESIHTETSRKYSLSELEELAADQGFEVLEHFSDERNYFVDSLWKIR